MANLSALLNRRTTIPSEINSDYGIVLPHESSLLNNPTACVIVGTTANFCAVAGNCCLWTVPAGVTQAQFQIWGAGGNSSSCSFAACCSMWPGGGSGEYTYVLMCVNPGQTFTLCAGGGSSMCSTCWNFNESFGCNSFVCGTNSTCILSCGGHPGGIYTGCSICSRQLYPKSSGHNNDKSNAYFGTNCDACTGLHFGWPSFRCAGDTSQTGPYTSANRILQSAKVPSIVGAMRSCGTSICYQCYFVPEITCNHQICTIGTGWNGGPCSGCFTNTLAQFNKPGVGGPAALFPCNGGGQGSSPDYGGRGRSGLVLVKYR